MDGYAQARCLFCETGKETRVVHAIHEGGLGRAIFAHRARFIRRGGKWDMVNMPLLPGYVFVYSQQAEARGFDARGIPHVIRALRYEDDGEALMGSDLRFADWLWRLNGEIGVIRTVKVGDRVEIADGVFRELQGKILHVNRRQRKVFVALDTRSIPIRTWLAYEQVERIDDGSECRLSHS